jgi:hypothetical protein
MRNLWWTMEPRGVDPVVCGHNHVYESFAQHDPTGKRSTRGIREVIIGTGGAPLIPFTGNPAPKSLVRDARHHGVLRLILRPDGWTQAFPTTDGASRDVVSVGCRP